MEQTLSIVKPDAVERNLENRIKSFFKDKNHYISYHIRYVMNTGIGEPPVRT